MRLKDMILIVAAELDADYEGGDFTVETLAVESWKRHPDAFGLRGYPLPDSGKAFAKICDLVTLGLLERTRTSCVMITRAGRSVAKELVRVHAAGSARTV
jgi:hypothetical protein